MYVYMYIYIYIYIYTVGEIHGNSKFIREDPTGTEHDKLS